MLLSNEFFEKVVKTTNQTKKEKVEKEFLKERNRRELSHKKHSRGHSYSVKWKDLTVSEFKTFLGLFY